MAVDELREKLVRKVAEAIWTLDGGLLRLLDESARFDSVLGEQQTLCWRQARAAIAALYP